MANRVPAVPERLAGAGRAAPRVRAAPAPALASGRRAALTLDHVWLAALIVAVVYAAIAAVLALTGKGKVQEAGPPVPEQAIESTKEDVEWAKTRARSGRT